MDHTKYIDKNFPKDLLKKNGVFDIPINAPKKSDIYFTDQLTECVKIRESKGKFSKCAPVTIPNSFADAVQKRPNGGALFYKNNVNDSFRKLTFKQYYQLSCQVAKALIQFGIEERSVIAISGFNSVEWFLSYHGSLFANCIASGIYVTNNTETCNFILNNCGVKVCIVEDDSQLKKYIEASKNCPSVKLFVQWSGNLKAETIKETELKVMKWSDFIVSGNNVTNAELHKRLSNVYPNECCTLIYTSGTTGPPKGVMLNHDNLTFMSTVFLDNVQADSGNERIVSYLPLSHIAAQFCDIILTLRTLAGVYFAQPDALKGSLGITLQQVNPTQLFGVPRVYEKIMEQLKDVGASSKGCKKSIATWAKDIGLKHNTALMEKKKSPVGCFKLALAKKLVFSKVQKKIGIIKCKAVYCAAAPLNIDVVRYFSSLNIIILDLYGMSETTGPHTYCKLKTYKHRTVGECPDDYQLKISDDGNDEILMGGRDCFMGYCNNKEKNNEAFDENNFVKSGDMGKIENGLLYITGRIKDLIITAGGENIAPSPIEAEIKSAIPFVSNVVVIGDTKKFLSCLLTVLCIMNQEDQSFTDTLAPSVLRWCEENGYTTHENSVKKFVNDKHPKVVKAIDEGIKIANEKAVSKSANVQKWKFLDNDFSQPTGELTPTLKVKRNIVIQKYQKEIDSMYTE